MTSLCSTLDDGKVEAMIPQLFRSLSQPSPLLITQVRVRVRVRVRVSRVSRVRVRVKG